MQRQFGFVIPPEDHNVPATTPRIVNVKAMSGGVLRVRVVKGGHAQVEIQAVVYNNNTRIEKTIQSTATL